MIRHEGSKYVVYDSTGNKKLGEYTSEEQAKARLKQIEYFKHIKKFFKLEDDNEYTNENGTRQPA